MILDLDDELDRGEDRQPFSNSDAGQAWTARWCDSCALNTNDDCPLATVALLGKTPFGWVNVGQPAQYLCAEYKEAEEDSSVQVPCVDRSAPAGDALRPATRVESPGRHRGE